MIEAKNLGLSINEIRDFLSSPQFIRLVGY
ncbi:hypothetical protein CVD27_27325 [Neobacillus cucumis]|uniref:HTH merR-type domain-containing protein n=1 Tax=Neobacillus cucumis TaxID=1740721 RepID=A0A2N5H6K0_9BACI|nr:hypothetical protein CVD27_27325 [Neobacillus cucumis]